MPEPSCHATPLADLASISIRGHDARQFLTAQLSQLPPGPGTAQAAFAGWHDAKGRVQALFRILDQADGYLLLTDASIADDVAAAMSRYILRADVRIEVAAGRNAGTAVFGNCDDWLAGSGIALEPALGATAHRGELSLLRLGRELVHVLGPADARAACTTELPTGAAANAELAEIELGLPVVSAPLRGQFLPQMLNLDRLGGIAFDKGCYPGQEIIARTQNLGAVKRRMRRFLLASATTRPLPATEVVDVAGSSVGTVVRSCTTARGIELLAVVTSSALTEPLRLDGGPETTLSKLSLPYDIPN